MPSVSEFHGIVIRMYYEDQADEGLPPHFHAYCGKQEAVFDCRRLRRLSGMLPRTVQTRVVEWAMAHRQELLSNWELAGKHEPLKPIEPLEPIERTE